MNQVGISAYSDRKVNALRAVATTCEASIAAKSDLETMTNHDTLEGLEGLNEKQRTADLIAKTATKREGVARVGQGL